MKRVYLVALLLIGGGLLMTRRRRPALDSGIETDEVTRASTDSFPASDPPSFTPLAGSQTNVAGGVR
jgi:hypothetical protein